MKELFNLCWMMLGWFVAGLIFLLCVALLVLTICLCIEISIELVKDVKGKLNENIQR